MHSFSQHAHVTDLLYDRMGKKKLQASAQSARAVLEAGQFEVLQCHGEHSVIAQVNALEKRLFSKSFALTGECQVAAQQIHDPYPQVLHDDVLCTSTCAGRPRLQHGPGISGRPIRKLLKPTARRTCRSHPSGARAAQHCASLCVRAAGVRGSRTWLHCVSNTANKIELHARLTQRHCVLKRCQQHLHSPKSALGFRCVRHFASGVAQRAPRQPACCVLQIPDQQRGVPHPEAGRAPGPSQTGHRRHTAAGRCKSETCTHVAKLVSSRERL
jgi:hypothetical protein